MAKALNLYKIPVVETTITEQGVRDIVSSNLRNFNEPAVMQQNYFQSANYVSGSTGWKITSAGVLEAVGATLSGTITASAGAIGGWTIDATSIYTGTEDHSGYTANAGDMTIYSDGADASIHAKNFYIDATGKFFSTSGAVSGVSITGVPNDTNTDIALLEMSHNLVFSVTDADTIAWATGTIIFSNGRSFSIDAGNTGNMSALTYIYLDPDTSATVLQTTTTYSTANGANKRLIGTAQNGAVTASFIPYGSGTALINGDLIGALSIVEGNVASSAITTAKIASDAVTAAEIATGAVGSTELATGAVIAGKITAGTIVSADIAANTITAANIAALTVTASEIAANTITAAKIAASTITTTEIAANTIVAGNIAAGTITATEMTVAQLSAISADMGTITAGTVTGATIQTASSGTRFVMTSSAFQGINSDGDTIFEVIIDGANAGDVIMGDDAAGSYAHWDNSAGTFKIYGSNLTPTFGDGSDGNVTISSPTTLTRDMYYDNLTVTSTLNVDGYKIYVKGTLDGAGTIYGATANVGTNASGSTPGSGGAAVGAGPLKGVAGSGGGGPTGGSGGDAGDTGTGGSFGNVGALGGGGGSAGNPGGSGGAIGTIISAQTRILDRASAVGMTYLVSAGGLAIQSPCGSTGGGEGGGAGVSPVPGGGGGAGSSGGLIWVAAGIWAGTFTISSVGGVGGNGGNGASGGGDAGGGGGGAGGNGGSSFVIYSTKTWSGSYVLTGGAGGTGGTAYDGGYAGTPSNGAAGATGNGGTSHEFNIFDLL